MTHRIVTIAFDPVAGAFDDSPLAALAEEVEVVAASPHFFEHGGLPYWTVFVQCRPPSTASRGARPRDGGSPSGARPRDRLPPEACERYDRLVAWRRGRADAEGVPPYVVLTNAQAAELAERAPVTLAALQEVRGIGERKVARYGTEMLEAVRDVEDS